MVDLQSNILKDISLLYELALSIGSSLDIEKNCENFLNVLFRRKKLSFVSVWIKRGAFQDIVEDNGTQYENIYASPLANRNNILISDQHPILLNLKEKDHISCTSADPLYGELNTEKATEKGAYVILKLGDFGFLKLYRGEEEEEIFQPKEFYKLGSVIRKFAISLRGCLAHNILLDEIVERKQIEEELRKSKEVKEQFFANMSHEIRTPLNGMLGMMNLMLNTHLTQEQKEYITDMKFSSNNLLAILNDILDFSKLKDKKVALELVKFDLKDLLKNLYNTYKAKAEEKGIRLGLSTDIDLPRYVEGDPVRLSQILTNLVGNAIKFTEDGEVNVSVRGREVGNKVQLYIQIKDTGIGISGDMLPLIFENFVQASKDTTRIYGGSGLGLAIVKQLVQLMQGQITVESELGAGTIFTVDVPVGKCGQEELQKRSEMAISADNSALVGYRILVVEDTFMNQKVIERLLSNWGIKVDIANNGKEAINILEDAYYDMILMDIQMPYMDGYDTTRHIRKHLEGPICEVPIIALTASARGRVRSDAHEAGMNDYVLKPFEPENLYSTIKHYLQGVEQRTGTVKEKKEEMSSKPASFNALSKEETSAVDFAYLKELAQGDDQFVKDMVDIFLEEAPIEVGVLGEAVDTLNWSQVKKSAHKLKYPFSSIGRKDLSKIFNEIEENALSEKDKKKLAQHFQVIDLASDKIISCLIDWRREVALSGTLS